MRAPSADPMSAFPGPMGHSTAPSLSSAQLDTAYDEFMQQIGLNDPGASSSTIASNNQARRERLRKLALETVDLSKVPHVDKYTLYVYVFIDLDDITKEAGENPPSGTFNCTRGSMANVNRLTFLCSNIYNKHTINIAGSLLYEKSFGFL